jgi:hypothetical protein
MRLFERVAHEVREFTERILRTVIHRGVPLVALLVGLLIGAATGAFVLEWACSRGYVECPNEESIQQERYNQLLES